MTINIVTHLAGLPGKQPPSSVRNFFRDLRIDLFSQQRSGSEYRALSCLFGLFELLNRGNQ
jgi:hypothetical protein